VNLRRLGQVLLLVSIMLGSLVGYMLHSYVKGLEASYGTTVKAIVAADAIPARTVITDKMLKIHYIPLQAFLPGMVREESKAELIGQTLLVAVRPGDVVTLPMAGAAPSDNPNARSYSLAQTDRVVIPEDLTGADKVDLLASYKDKDGKLITKVILQGVRVVNVKAEGRQRVVALALSSADAETLAWYENFGQQLRLLRVG
jgi:hypothetical protein